MPLVDESTVVAGSGRVLLGATTAAKPTLAAITTFLSAGTLPAGLVEIGHTSIDDVLVFSQDGGDSTVLASWQNSALRNINTSAAVDSFVIKSLQLKDNAALDMYYGGGDVSVANEFSVLDTPIIQEKSVLVVIADSASPIAMWVPRASVQRDDSPDFPSDDFATLPIRFTLLKKTGVPKLTWISDLLGAAV